MKSKNSVFERIIKKNLDICVVDQPGYKEHFISVILAPGKNGLDDALLELFSYLKDTGAKIIMHIVFGGGLVKPVIIGKMKNINGTAGWPVMGLDHDNGGSFPVSGMQIFAVSGAVLKEIKIKGEVEGFSYDTADAEFVLLSNVQPEDKTLSPGEQTRQVYDKAVLALKEAGMDFSHVTRTWFYLDKLLAWYKEFNDARNGFFQENDIFLKLVPASTGIGARNYEGTALATAFFAVKPKNNNISISKVDSPLQCEAYCYKSAFSRAAEIKTGNSRKLMVSGTASISPDGKSACIGDLEKQIDLTMKVVKEILYSRAMDWTDVTRSIVYLKDKNTALAFYRYREQNNIPPFPAIIAYTTVCREELLYEIELDAVKDNN